MRFFFLTCTVALLAGCGVALDFDPNDPDASSGRDGSAVTDSGAIDATRDANASDGGATNDFGPSDGGSSTDAIVVDAAPLSCTSSDECGAIDAGYCEFLPAVCGGIGTCQPIPSACTALAMPVCGCDGNDYGNPCEAAHASVSIFSTGRCVRDGGVDPCGTIAGLTRGCTGDSACTFGVHQTDCCGNTVALGLNHSAATLFSTLEPACEATYPPCGCPAGLTTTDSDETASDPTTIQVACVRRGGVGTCMTYVSARPPDG